MSPEEQHILKVLPNATLKECLAWFEDAPDDTIKDALRPLLFDEQSGAVRVVQDGVLQDELVELARTNGDFRRFVKDWWQATLDRITAAYLKEMIKSS